jgi:hypothetical protein
MQVKQTTEDIPLEGDTIVLKHVVAITNEWLLVICNNHFQLSVAMFYYISHMSLLCALPESC